MTTDADKALADRIEATGLPSRRSYAICLKIEEWDAVVACLRKSPDKAPAEDEIKWALQAIADGYEGSVNNGFIIVANPDATPEGIALRGENSNLVINAKQLLAMLTSGQRHD